MTQIEVLREIVVLEFVTAENPNVHSFYLYLEFDFMIFDTLMQFIALTNNKKPLTCSSCESASTMAELPDVFSGVDDGLDERLMAPPAVELTLSSAAVESLLGAEDGDSS